jgi:hypothetical protein
MESIKIIQSQTREFLAIMEKESIYDKMEV